MLNLMEVSDQVLFVDKKPLLEALCTRLKDYAWLAIDTEFHREKTYYPQLCLLQIGTSDFVACIDALSLKDLHPLLEVLYDRRITKVMHAGRQDLEIFYHMCGELPVPVFDTQIAAMLLGYPEQISYAGLVFELLGVRLRKAYTRADWTCRPLPAEQLRYAVEDAYYLAEIYRTMDKELRLRGRLDWLKEELAVLADPAPYSNPPECAWQRVSGSEQLHERELSVLQALAAWREQTARKENRPRHWLIKDETLVALARLQPETEDELKRINGLHPRIAGQHRRQLLELIAQGKMRPSPPPAPHRRFKRLTLTQEALVDCLMAVVRLRSHEHRLNPAVLVSRKELERLVCEEQGPNRLCGWRRDVVGLDLMALLKGELSLMMDKGRLLLKRANER